MLVRAAIFDFDGTLARPALDFPRMKRGIALLAGEYLGQAEPGRGDSPGGLPLPAGTAFRNMPDDLAALTLPQRAERAEGVQPAEPAERAPALALPALEWIELLAGRIGGGRGAQFRERAQALIAEMEREAAARTSLFPFARPLLRALEAQGVAVGIITRNSRLSVDTVFPDAADFVRVVLAREDVRAVKPDPAHLLAALARLDCPGCGPESALMVGDHPTDVLTARRAGTASAAVASGGTSLETLRLAGPDVLTADAGELLDALAARGWLDTFRSTL